jgi:hypothetical protein
MASFIETKANKAQELYSNPNTYGSVKPQQYRYSFSGADARMTVFFPQRPDLISYLDSVHTISISVHEAKSQVRALGYRGIKGLTRSVRTIAGSMILTVVNDHPLRPLLEQYNSMIFSMGEDNGDVNYNPMPFGWSVDRDELGVGTHADIYAFNNRLSALLPPFSLIMEFVAEMAPVTIDRSENALAGLSGRDAQGRTLPPPTGTRALFPGAGLMLQEIEFVDEGFVVSVNDMVTEVTLSFIARDFKPISANMFHDGGQALRQSDIAAREYELWKRMNPEHTITNRNPSADFGEHEEMTPLRVTELEWGKK